MGNLFKIGIAVFIVLIVLYALLLHISGDEPRPGAKPYYLGPARMSAENDKEYAEKVSTANKLERAGDLEKALVVYKEATVTNRFQMPSYYPLLKIGIIQCKLRKAAEAKRTLQNFIHFAESEINPTADAPFMIDQNTPQHLEELRKDLSSAKVLLQGCK